MSKQPDLSSMELLDWDNCVLRCKRIEENRGLLEKRHIILKHI